jgi:transcription-repair coupling factor (superfamily II helicase)
MDRLLCGDVGYGKTEVAMRAAFKAVLDNKQVAILVPTTVLAQQHGITFTERFAPYPVSVDVLSRFRSKKEQDDVVKRLALGKVDILIGTHRLLGQDVAFKDLGLVIVDEEHRFGVKHKERLRDIKKEVDVLTLTATPIPRTLQMSIADIRGLSIIATPPEDRLAIKTVVSVFDEGLIKDAIEREVRRGGQVFFVHNRVESIGAIAELLERIVPDVRVAVAHGQMRERELEGKMLGFMDHSYDVLLCTTIIESGLDIASANTIIINRADRFGLAELYQLRGRVGRSNHRAYAYLLCPLTRLKEDARKRLDAITMLTEPGSGFQVASHDLEIRGAGELLGASQSGHIAEVGFDMYTRLLEEAVAELRGEPVSREPVPEVNLRLSAYIPEDYIPDTRQRLGIYKRLSSLGSEDELFALTEELEDRYGEVPELVLSLIEMASIRLLLAKLGAIELKELGPRLYIRFSVNTEEGGGGPGEDVVNKALSLMKKEPKRYRITKDGRFVYSMAGPEPDPIEEARYILKEFLQ